MKKFSLFAITMAIATAFTVSCTKDLASKDEESSEDSVTVNFDSGEGDTKSAVPDYDDRSLPDGGCIAAFYSKSTGALLAYGSSSSRSVIINKVPKEDCYVYGVANPAEELTSIKWPDTIDGLASFGGSITLMDNKTFIPRSTDLETGSANSKFVWSVGDKKVNVETSVLCARVYVQNSLLGDKWTMKNATVSKCPKSVNFFGAQSSAAGTATGNDYITDADLTAFARGGESYVYVPVGVSAELTVNGSESLQDGFDKYDKFTFSIDNLTKAQKKYVEIDESGSGSSKADVGKVDTRIVCFNVSSITIDKKNGTSLFACGYAKNGGKDWVYDISWEGDHRLAGTYLVYDGVNYGLSDDGEIIGIQGDAEQKELYITTTYSEDDDIVIPMKIISDDSEQKSVCSITVPGGETPFINLSADNIEFSWCGTYKHDSPYFYPEKSGYYNDYCQVKESSDEPRKVFVETNCTSWSIVSSPSWCSVTKESGAISISAHSITNPSADNNTGEIVLTGVNVKGEPTTKTITLTQKAPLSWMKFPSAPYIDKKMVSANENLTVTVSFKTSVSTQNFRVVSVIAVKGTFPEKEGPLYDEDLVASIKNNISYTYAGKDDSDKVTPYKYNAKIVIPKATIQAYRNRAGADGCGIYLDFDDVENGLYGNQTTVSPKGKSPIIYGINSGLPRYTIRLY